MHFLSSCMVALGAHFSAIWIIVAHSWMQTPAGYKLVEVNGKIQAHITSFYDVVFKDVYKRQMSARTFTPPPAN